MGVRELVLFMVIEFIVRCLLEVFMAIRSAYPKYLSTLLPLPLSQHSYLKKVLSIVICILHLNGRKLENRGMPMVVCISRMSHEWTHITFQANECEWSVFSKSEALLVYLSLLNSMCLYDVLYGSLAVIKFVTRFMGLHCFQNIFTFFWFWNILCTIWGCH